MSRLSSLMNNMESHHAPQLIVRHRLYRLMQRRLVRQGCMMMVTVVVMLLGASVAYARQFDGRVPPRTFIGGVPIGGMTAEDLTNYVRTINETLLKEGITFRFWLDGEAQKFTVNPRVILSD